MIESDIEFLQCTKCGANLVFAKLTKDGSGAIVNGVAVCSFCNIRYPLVNYVIIFASSFAAKKLLSPESYLLFSTYKGSSENHDYQYTHDTIRSGENWNEQLGISFRISSQLLGNNGFWGSEAFWKFCGLEAAQLTNKKICVYCGGSGREAYHLLNTDVQKVFVIDIGPHIFNIHSLCAKTNNRLILIMTDFYQNPVKSQNIDISICDHALQHIENNKKAFTYVAEKAKNGGLISMCVYSYEHNFIMTKLIEPLKCIFRRLPNWMLLRVSYILAIVLFFLHKFYSLLTYIVKNLEEKLPYFELFSLWGKDGFHKFHEVCFDLLHAPISHHFKQNELLDLARLNSLKIVKFYQVNNTMWTIVSRKYNFNKLDTEI